MFFRKKKDTCHLRGSDNSPNGVGKNNSIGGDTLAAKTKDMHPRNRPLAPGGNTSPLWLALAMAAKGACG